MCVTVGWFFHGYVACKCYKGLDTWRAAAIDCFWIELQNLIRQDGAPTHVGTQGDSFTMCPSQVLQPGEQMRQSSLWQKLLKVKNRRNNDISDDPTCISCCSVSECRFETYQREPCAPTEGGKHINACLETCWSTFSVLKKFSSNVLLPHIFNPLPLQTDCCFKSGCM